MATVTTVSSSQSLSGDVDAESIARQIPKTNLVKGMFFARHVSMLGAEFANVTQSLEAPPRFGKYVPFSDYPQSDYMRVMSAVARKSYARLGLREGMRRLGRDDFNVFGESTFGRVILAVVGDAKAALLKTPGIYMKMAPGDWIATGEEIDDTTVRIEFCPTYGSWEYQLGQLEGVVMKYGVQPTTTITELPGPLIRYDMQLGS
jgi:uncharacterized protein (TIGR02265 family)